MHVNNKVVLLTGAGSGIGQALAGELAKQGAKLIITDLSEDALVKTIEKYQCQSQVLGYFTTNLLDDDAPEKILQQAQGLSERIDILINNAGMMAMGQVRNMQWQDYQRMQQVNQNAAIKLSYLLLPSFIAKGSGAIAFTCSASAICSPPGAAFYSMTKAAVCAFAESLRAELRTKNISVTAICPGFVRTPLAQNINYRDEKAKQQTQNVPFFIGSSPERIARLTIKSINRKKGTVLIGWDEKVKHFFKKFCPPAYEKINQLMGTQLLDD